MDAPQATRELGLRLSTSQLTTTAAAWHVLGLLLSLGRPAHPSELASDFILFDPTPESIRFLCSIPNSPLRLVDNGFVTFSQAGFAAIARFFANSNLIARCLDFPRLLTSFRSNGIERTYFRKRKRSILEVADLALMKKKSCFQDLNGQRYPGQMVMSIPSGSQTVHTQGIEILSRPLPLLVYDFCEVKKIMSKPLTFSKSRSGQFSYEIENAEHECDKIEVEIPNLEGFGHLHRDDCGPLSVQGRSSHIHRLVAEGLIDSAPLLELSHPSCLMGDSEARRTCVIDIVYPINSMNICAPSKLEVDEHMIVSQENIKAVTQGCESLSEDMDGKVKEVLLFDSEGSKGQKENPPTDRSHKDIYDRANSRKTLHGYNRNTNNKALLVRSRLEGHPQSKGGTLNHLMKHSSILTPDRNDEAYDMEIAIRPTMENCKGLPDKGPEQVNGDKNLTSEEQATKFSCEQNIDANEKRETSIENRRRPSSKQKNIGQKPFPDFGSFVVEEEEGSGGYGTVYRARRKADGVIFAIKCPHDNANRNYVINEMKMLERLGGKNFVIKYEGSFKSGAADCLVLEHVKHDRPEILKREMNVTDLQWYGYCLFKALACLHKQGIVHRDVKPGNFLYSRKINNGYLIDFNLALDMRKKYGSNDSSKARHSFNDLVAVSQSAKTRKLMNTTSANAVNKTKVSKSLLPPGNLKKKVDKAKIFTDGSSRNIIKSQGADGSGITSAKDATSTRTLSAERLREPLPSVGRKELLSLAQESLHGGIQESVNAPKSNRKRVAAPSGDADSKFLYTTPMPLHSNGIAIRGAGLLKTKGDGKSRREGPSVGTKGFKAPEVLLRSLHQGPKADIWSAGVTLLYLMIGRTPFTGDTDQNLKEIAKFRGSEDLWEVAKLHNNEALFPTELLDVKYCTSPVNIGEWCAQNARRSDLIEAIPRSLFDLVDKCLMVNPRQRISADEALRHGFFAPCHEALRKHRLQRQATSSQPS